MHFLSGENNSYSRSNRDDIIFTGGAATSTNNDKKSSLIKALAEYDVIRIHITDKQYDRRLLGRGRTSTNTLYDVVKQTYMEYTLPSHVAASAASTDSVVEGSSTLTRFHSLFDRYLESEDLLHVKDAHILASKCGGGGPFGRGGTGQRQLLYTVADRILNNGNNPAKAGAGSNTSASACAQSDRAEVRGKEPEPESSQEATTSAPFVDIFSAQSVYLFSLEKGHLLLSPDFRDRHNISRLEITIPRNSRCFGGTAISWLVHEVVGYDIVIMNWLRSAVGERGYLYNVRTKELFNINYSMAYRPLWSLLASWVAASSSSSSSSPSSGADMVFGGDSWGSAYLSELLTFKAGVMFTTLFLFFTATTLVSFVLRETQERMLKFTFLLQHHIAHRIPFTRLVVTHVVESLVFVPIVVGILFFLFEFFSDQLLAFLVLSVVWVAEVYSVICLRTTLSINFFPRLFFFYFVLFHIYFFSYPFGFAYLALLAYVLLLAHAMIRFWNKYEVPALEGGYITALTPRMGYQSFHIDDHINNSYDNVSAGGSGSSPERAQVSPGSSPTRASSVRAAATPSDGAGQRSPPRAAAGALPLNRRHLSSASEGPTWQSRTLQQTLNSTTIYSGGRVDDFRNYVEMSRRIQQQQMRFQFGHLGLGYPTAARADRDGEGSRSAASRSVSDDTCSRSGTFLGGWVDLIGKRFGLGAETSQGAMKSSPRSTIVEAANGDDEFYIGHAPISGVSDNEGGYSSDNEGGMLAGSYSRRVRSQSEQAHRADTRSGSGIRKQRTRSYPLQSFPSIGSGSSGGDEGLRRRPSINDFGYRKNSFQIFGNNFEED